MIGRAHHFQVARSIEPLLYRPARTHELALRIFNKKEGARKVLEQLLERYDQINLREEIPAQPDLCTTGQRRDTARRCLARVRWLHVRIFIGFVRIRQYSRPTFC